MYIYYIYIYMYIYIVYIVQVMSSTRIQSQRCTATPILYFA